MLRRLFWITFGAAIALQIDRWWRAQRSRFTPNALTGSLLDALNRRLEERNSSSAV
ncbi:MAG TPA: hypothetical protein VM573_03970 [Actinomycetota bacterium]|jgi:hypothetical protein|nr:hypothetical protein [Actinomycetota bacterium]